MPLPPLHPRSTAVGLLAVALASGASSAHARQSIQVTPSGLSATNAAGSTFDLGSASLSAPVLGLLEDTLEVLAAGASMSVDTDSVGTRLTWTTKVGSDDVEALFLMRGVFSDDWSDHSGVVLALLFPDGDTSPRDLIRSLDPDQAIWQGLESKLDQQLGESAGAAVHGGLLTAGFAVESPFLVLSGITEPAEITFEESGGTKHSMEVGQGLNFLATLSGNTESIESSFAGFADNSEALEGVADVGLGFLGDLAASLGTVEMQVHVAATDVIDEVLEESSFTITFPFEQTVFSETLDLPGDSTYALGLTLEDLSLSAGVSSWSAGTTLTFEDDGDSVELTGGIGIELDEETAGLTYVWEFGMQPDGEWDEPFAIPGLVVSGASLGFDYDPAKGGSLITAVENFAFEGEASLGNSDGTLSLMKETDDDDGTVGFGIKATLDTLTLKNLVGLAYPSKKKDVPKSIAGLGLKDVSILASTAPDIDFTGNAAAAILGDGEQGDLDIGQGFEVTGTYSTGENLELTYSTRAGFNGGVASGKLAYGFAISGGTGSLLDEIAGELKSPLKGIVEELGNSASNVLEFEIEKLSGSVEAELENLDGQAQASFSARADFKFDPAAIGSGAFDAVGIEPIDFGGIDETIDVAFRAKIALAADPKDYAQVIYEETWGVVADAVPVQESWGKVKQVANVVADQAEAIGDGFEQFFALAAQALEAILNGQFIGSTTSVDKVTKTNLNEKKLQRIDSATAIFQQARSYGEQRRIFRDQLGLKDSFSASDLAELPAEDTHVLALMGHALERGVNTLRVARDAGKAAPDYWIKTTKTKTTQHDFIGIDIGTEQETSTKVDNYDPGETIEDEAKERIDKLKPLRNLVRDELAKRLADDPDLAIDGESGGDAIAARAISRAWSERSAAETYTPVQEMFVIVRTSDGDNAATNKPINLLIEETDGSKTRIPLDSSGNDFDKNRFSTFWLGPDAVGHLIPERIARAGFENPWKNIWACDRFWIFFRTETGRYRYESPWKSLMYRDGWFKVGVDYQNDTEKSRTWSVSDRQGGCRTNGLYDDYVVFATVSTRDKSGGNQEIRLSEGVHSNKLQRPNESTSYSRGWTYRLVFKKQSADNDFLTGLESDDVMELQAGGNDGVRLIHAFVVGVSDDGERWDVLGTLRNNGQSLSLGEKPYKERRTLSFNRYRHNPDGLDSKQPVDGLIVD